MKRNRSLCENRRSVSAAAMSFGIVLSLALSGCTEENSAAEPSASPGSAYELTGTWEQTNDSETDSTYTVQIEDGTIVVMQITDDEEEVYWVGSFEVSETNKEENSVTVVSARSDSETMVSEEETIVFEIADENLLFSVMEDDEVKSVMMEKSSEKAGETEETENAVQTSEPTAEAETSKSGDTATLTSTGNSAGSSGTKQNTSGATGSKSTATSVSSSGSGSSSSSGSSSKPSSSTGSSGSSSSGSSSNSSSSSSSGSSTANKTRVWVVDKAAWTETVVVKEAWTETVTEVVTPAWDETVVVKEGYSVTICNLCGAQFTAPGEQQLIDLENHGWTTHGQCNYHTDTIPAETKIVHHDAVTTTKTIEHPAETKQVYHEEEGHWEYR